MTKKTVKPDSEEALELAAIACFESLGAWQSVNAFHESYGPNGTLGRETPHQTVLTRRLMSALQKLNPALPAAALDAAVEELTRDRSAMSAAHANRETMQLLRDGVPVRFKIEADEDESDGESDGEATVRVLDWNDAAQNDFLLVQQLWISGEMYSRRADLVGFVNGLPLVFIELKASHKSVENAFHDNLRDYKDTIPHIFWHNAFIILSNGMDSRVGSLTADWEHFVEWKKISSEEEAGVISLETTIRGTCEPTRLLDLAENFSVFQETSGGLIKMLAKNHQFLGVNNAIEAARDIDGNQGKLGVFWHTQGSGKSLSMVFFAQKVLRKLPGDWTFLILTDRDDLDGQIYKNFASCGIVTEPEPDISAQNGKHLQQLLGENHRYVFTLIQKFHTERGASYPQLSDRSNLIVMTDEAHRSQYDIFARNMRAALPNASFIGFTGTPLMAGEEKTKEVFGDYVSVYSFRDAIEDRATVPLFYDNRIPELQLTNDDLNEEMQQLIEDAALDEEQEKALEREFKREYHLITREERLDEIAADLVSHFMGRGRLDKAMVLSIDKATAVRMFDKVKKHWANHCAGLREKLLVAVPQEREALAAQIAFMEETDMAVVVSSGQNEVDDFKKKGLDIAPHRKRIMSEDLETKFKDPKDPFRIVFVCAMWIVGFDVPCCSTIYLDKPMRNHSLMQAIARANRVFGDKTNGLIVDYIGVFRELEKALAVYAVGKSQGEEKPIRPKSELVEALAVAADEATTLCIERNVSLGAIGAAQGFARIKLLADAREAILESDETKKKFMAHASRVDRLFKAILPDADADLFKPTRTTLMVIAESIRSFTTQADISDVMAQVDQLLDKSVAAEAYQIQPGGQKELTDLSTIDFEALQATFETGHKRTETEKLKGALNAKLKTMVRLNRTRMDYLEKFEQMIADYNAGASNIVQLFGQLVELTRGLQAEEKRHLAESLTEEELAVFDLLTKPDVELSVNEKKQVKSIARELLETLKREQLVLDWRKGQQSRAAVRLQIEQKLDTLPARYDKAAFDQKVEVVYQHVYDSYFGLQRSVYSAMV